MSFPSSVVRALAPFDIDTLENESSTAFGVAANLRIVYVNSAWTAFAQANGAHWSAGEWGVGSHVLDAVPEILRPFYRQLYGKARREHAVVEHDYECSSPDLSRRFRMRIFPTDDDGLVVVHTLLKVSAHARAGATAEESA